MQVLFDSKSAPREALDWLAGWLGLALEPQWSEEKRRLMIRHAVAFYRLRGTIAGLDLALRLAFEDPVDPDVFRCLEQGRIPVGRLRSIRMLEEFRVRMTPRILLGDPTVDDAPILVSLEQAWDPSQDIATLDQRYQERTGDPGRSYPLSPPSDEAERPVWERFSMEVLGFVPSAKATDLSRWRDYLRRQYRGIERLRGAHGTGYLDFDDIPLPKDDRPVTESARRDWFRFESVVVPTARSAHRFSVFVPAPEQLGAHPMREAEIVKLARRVVELEKPAHTTFTVDLYFAVVRLGRVRLGYDTVVGPGSRTPWLTPELLVGQVAVGEGWIPPRSKDQATERFVVGDRALSQDNRI